MTSADTTGSAAARALSGSDVIAAKIVVQLALLGAGEVRAELAAMAAAPPTGRDLMNRLADLGKLAEAQVTLVRQRTALYEHVRAEASYLRLLEKRAGVDRGAVAALIFELERTEFRRRLGDVLVEQGKLSKEDDRAFAERQRRALEKEDAKIVERYVAEGFEGVARPLVPGSTLVPDDLRISKLFRGRATRVLVDQERIKALREVEEHELDPFPPAAPRETAKTEKWDPRELAKSFAPVDEAGSPPNEDGSAPCEEAAALQPHVRGLERVRGMTRIADYSIVEVLGAGGMGAVFLGTKDGRGELAAIKVMLNEAAGEKERGRFKREIALTQRVQHKNVIGIIESGETEDGLSYLVVPALPGKELRAVLDAAGGKGLPPGEACDLFEQILEGMSAVHAARIVHRDLKPENIMLVGAERTVRIMDFGLAKLEEEADPEGAARFYDTTKFEIVGSPAYIAPESVTRDKIDPRTDIYSLGVLFFELLTGKLPIEAADPLDYLEKHMVCPPLGLREAKGGPGIEWPREAETLLARMLAKTRAERPPTCAAVLAELRGTTGAKLRAMGLAGGAAPVRDLDGKPPTRGLLGRLLGRGKS